MKKLCLLLGIVALFIIIANCTPAGADLRLVGTWEYSEGGKTITLTIGNDDSFKWEQGSFSMSGKITKADSSKETFTVEWDNGISSDFSYHFIWDWSAITLTFEDGSKMEFKKK